MPYTETDLTHQLSQEVRLTSQGDDRLHWVAGAFFSDLHSTWVEQSANPAYGTLSPPGTDKGVNPRFNLSYSPNRDLTTYISASKGFRPGGANEQVPVSLCGAAPSSFGPDTIWDYEVGEKAKLFDNWLTKNYKLTARISDSYAGASVDESYYFGIQLPSYSIANTRVGLSGDKWSVDFFVDNLTNKVAQMTANNTSFQFNIPYVVRYSTNQPRTFGTQINYRF